MMRRLMFIFTLVLLGWIVCVQLGCMAMRTSDRSWQSKLQELGQKTPPDFCDVTMPDGRRIHAVSIGAPTTHPAMMFVHGSPGSADAFLQYLGDTTLTTKTQLIAIDRPGFGYSNFGKPEPSLQKQAAAVKAVADRLAPGRPLLLVGHSMGGPVIARFAQDYPEQTAGLVMVAASVDPKQEEHPWWQKAVDNPPLCWLTPKSLWTSNYEIRRLESELDLMLPLWGSIHCPVSILHAVDDQLVPYANVAFMQQHLPQTTRVGLKTFPSGNHFILWNRYTEVKKVILEQLK